MAVLKDLSRQNATDVGAWSRLSRVTTKSADGKAQSVYQHELTEGTHRLYLEVHLAERPLVMTVENTLATMITAEQEKSRRNDGHDVGTPIAQWIHDGMSIERSQ
jgi:hypothetical protein